MSFRVDIVVLSNVPKALGPGVEVVVLAPKGDPWTFPFAHKNVLADRLNEYDLFLYSEDDTLITERNLQAFLKATELLPDDELAGFLRSEVTPDGEMYYSTVHGHFHWDASSVTHRHGHTFASFTNAHSACYVLTRKQLGRAVQSGGFLVEPHEGHYDLMATAATDPYTQCGFRKMVCISHIEDFTLPHLPNKYLGKQGMGLRRDEFVRQVRALLDIDSDRRPCSKLFEPETRAPLAAWSKSYYESANAEMASLIPKGARSVLSLGCGWGATESYLVKRGLRVVGVPMDSVIAACAESKGVEIVFGDFESARRELSGQSFDCILLSNVLHLLADPTAVLSAFAGLLSASGVVIASVPNLGQLAVWLGRLRGKSQYAGLDGYEKTGLHLTSAGLLRKWFKRSDLRVSRTTKVVPQRRRALNRWTAGLGKAALAEELIVLGKRA